jgi:GNAT superfamily N-acetyltransferase
MLIARENIEIYRSAMRLLLENLPTDKMKTIASRLFQNPNNPERTYACLENQMVVGTAIGGPLNRQKSYWEFMFILPEYRQLGVGKELLAFLEKTQKKYGISQIETETYEPLVTQWVQRRGYKIVSRNGMEVCHCKEI